MCIRDSLFALAVEEYMFPIGDTAGQMVAFRFGVILSSLQNPVASRGWGLSFFRKPKTPHGSGEHKAAQLDRM
eukprot:4246247-Prorocentrum_lima.AAC.1